MRLVALLVVLAAAVPACRGQGNSQTSAEGGAGSAAALPLPPEVQVSPPVCVLKTDLFRPLTDIPIRASGTTPPYATVAGATAGLLSPRHLLRADLGIPGDDDMPFSLRVVSNAFDIRGLAERTLPVYAGNPLALGSFAAALPHTELRVIHATSVEVEVEAQLGPSIEILAGAPRARGPCGLFAFERRDFAAAAVIPGVKWKSEPDALLKKGRKIALTTLPIGEPVARIEIRPGDNPAVIVFEKDKDRAHIGWTGGTLMIHGWIATSDLEPMPKDATPKADAGLPAKKPDEAPPPVTPPVTPSERLACAEPVPVVALIGESRTTVGKLLAGGAFEVIGRDKGWAEVRGDMPLVTFTKGARLVVRESDLGLCTPPKPPAPKAPPTPKAPTPPKAPAPPAAPAAPK